MLDIAVAYNRYKFLGYEYLSWLWFMLETDPGALLKQAGEEGILEIGNRIILEKRFKNDVMESVLIKGDDAGLEEGVLALKKGALVTELNLILRQGGQTWQFTLKGESFHFTNVKIPEQRSVHDGKDIEGIILEKAALCEKIINLTEKWFHLFIALRVSSRWKQEILPLFRKWTKPPHPASA